MLRTIATVFAAVVLLGTGSLSFGQNAPRIPQMSPEVLASRDALLRQWSASSDGIKTLEGAVLRIVYDDSFKAESRSIGRLTYQKPDKGIIIFEPEPVTEEVIQKRQQQFEDALKNGKPSPIKVDPKTGRPYQLRPDGPEEFWCDGVKIYEIDRQAKEAIIADLPPQLNGKNIMESPLPFFFGMPPERANRRFEIGFSGSAPAPGSASAQLIIFPNEPQDAQIWHHVDVILNLQTYLPVAVRVHDPAQTRVSVYSFADLKVNPVSLTSRRFVPDLDGLKAVISGPVTPEPVGPGIAEVPQGTAAVVPNLLGLNHKDALQKLAQVGLTRDAEAPEKSQVVVLKGNITNNNARVFSVETQDPAAGTPIQKNTRVTLRLWIK